MKNITYHQQTSALSLAANKIAAIPVIRKTFAPELTKASIIAAAIKSTGHDDFGGDDFLEPLEILLESLNNEANLNAFGSYIAATMITEDLAKRLRLVSAMHNNPSISQEKIEKPIYIIGLPRTGTTLLQEILSQDDQLRYLSTWESDMPFPHPDKKTYRTDKRRFRVGAKYLAMNLLAPGFDAIHDMKAGLPQECIVIQAISLRSRSYNTFHVPGYLQWLDQCDMTIAYQWHKKMLQYLQYNCKAARWILKSPWNLYSIAELMRIYPDACLIQTHRTLHDTIPSLCSLSAKLQGCSTNNLATEKVGAEMFRYTKGIHQLMNTRATNKHINNSIIDINYNETVIDPMCVIRKIYAFSGMDLTEDTELSMAQYLHKKPQHQNGKHVYKSEWFGITSEMIDSEFSGYHEKYIL